ncbi:isochorismatase family protein [Paramixta manurensis]|uniref:Isochorismatase family protein n=1 Tax=Paramixta manurensis TaxID=2740817 RepID=A0A6M8UDR5_9GAMM|nr:isochorismatase family protein [Erwiniaceae bacterium PD-1]
MPLSTLDNLPALIVVDMQKGIVGLPLAHPTESIIDNNAKLAQAFRARGLPVVLVNVTSGAPGRVEMAHDFTPPADWAELIPELGEHPDDHKVTKLQWGSFHGTSLDLYLRRRGVTQVIITGIATSIGVESTARHAHELGYHVVLVTDAMTDLELVSHQHSIEKIFPRLGERVTTDALLQLLDEK